MKNLLLESKAGGLTHFFIACGNLCTKSIPSNIDNQQRAEIRSLLESGHHVFADNRGVCYALKNGLKRVMMRIVRKTEMRVYKLNINSVEIITTSDELAEADIDEFQYIRGLIFLARKYKTEITIM